MFGLDDTPHDLSPEEEEKVRAFGMTSEGERLGFYDLISKLEQEFPPTADCGTEPKE